MAYNRRNKLLQMHLVIAIYQQHKRDGVSTEHIYREYIYPRYPISRTTLYNYLATPVEKLLKEEEAKRKARNQLQLF